MYIFIFYLKGFNFQPPPLLPRNHIERHGLLKHMVDALVQEDTCSNINVNLLITGMAGYGKSTLAIISRQLRIISLVELYGFS